MDAYSTEFLGILTSAYSPAEENIFKFIRRKIDVLEFTDGREIRDKDIERALQKPRYKSMYHILLYYSDLNPSLSSIQLESIRISSLL